MINTKSKGTGAVYIETEIAVLKTVFHASIIRLFDVVTEGAYVFCVMQRAMGGELFERIVEAETYTEGHARRVIERIADGVLYLHSRGIMHRGV